MILQLPIVDYSLIEKITSFLRRKHYKNLEKKTRRSLSKNTTHTYPVYMDDDITKLIWARNIIQFTIMTLRRNQMMKRQYCDSVIEATF